MQQEYSQAVQEQEREEQCVKQATAIMKNGLQGRLAGFTEIDFFGDNTRSVGEITGNRPVPRSNTVDGASNLFQTSPRNSLITIDVQAPEGMAPRANFMELEFLLQCNTAGPDGLGGARPAICHTQLSAKERKTMSLGLAHSDSLCRTLSLGGFCRSWGRSH